MEILLSATQDSMFHSPTALWTFSYILIFAGRANIRKNKQSCILLNPVSRWYSDEEWSRKALRCYTAVVPTRTRFILDFFHNLQLLAHCNIDFLNNLLIQFSLGTARETNISPFAKMFYVLFQAVASTICPQQKG